MKKYIVILFLIILVIPSIVLASWWNPFSWHWPWSENKVSQEQQMPIIEQPVVKEKLDILNTQNKKTETVLPPKNEDKKVTIPVKTIPTVNKPLSVPEKIIPVVTAPIELSISDISIETKSNSALVNWKTSIPSESKILIEGKSYFSERGVGTVHFANIINLEPDLSYGGTITAIANNAWKSLNFNFITKTTPLSITITSQNCPTESCTIKWKTNYNSTGKVTIYKKSSNTSVLSIDSTSNGNEHSLVVKLEPNTEYTFTVYATSENRTAESTSSFTTLFTQPACGNARGWCASA